EDGGALFVVDQLLPGRVGQGEAWEWQKLQIDLTVRAAGELVLRERLHQSGEELRQVADRAGSGAAASLANAILSASDSRAADVGSWRAALAALHGDGLWLGVSELR